VSDAPTTLHAFLEGVRSGTLTAIRCVKCGAAAIPPKQFCPECGQRQWEPLPLSGKGTIASFTVIRVAPRGHAGEAPYAIAAVRLEEGVSLLGRVVDVPLERLAVGLPVTFRPVQSRGQTVVGFGPT
jgi:uncharacterized OB-fold protein